MSCCYSCKHWERPDCSRSEGGDKAKPWERFGCYEPKILITETDEYYEEFFKVAYLRCWIERCPFKEECYKKGEPYIA
ncbi:MAG: hypothetical protein ACE5PM_00665 [Candidatus Hydrothermarchaeales archaeon]